MAASNSEVTLDEILQANKKRKSFLKSIKDLKTSIQTTQNPTEIPELEILIKELKEKVKIYRDQEADLLREASIDVRQKYYETVAIRQQHPSFAQIAAQNQPATEEPVPAYSGYRESVTSPVTLSSDTESESDYTEKDPNKLHIQTENVDTSPGRGFEKFFKRRSQGATPVPPPKKGKAKMTTVVAYTPPAFGTVYDGSTNIAKFFNRYEAFATTYAWDSKIKISQLEFHLKGAALKCFNNIRKTSADVDFTYTKVKASLEKYFASKTSTQEYEKKLRERKLIHGESMEVYFWDVVDLVHKLYKTVDFDIMRDQVLKGLPASTAKDIWNGKPTTKDELHALILEQQKFESLMGKKSFGTDDQSVNACVHHLEALGFDVKKGSKQEVNSSVNKRKGKKKGNNNNRNVNSQQWNRSSTQSSMQTQSHPRPNYRNNNNNRRGSQGNYNNNRQYNNNNFNSWRQGPRNYEPQQNSRGYGQRPQGGSYQRQQPQQYMNRNQFGPRQARQYINNYDNYYSYEEGPYDPPGQAYPVHYGPPALPQNVHSVNTVSGNGFI